jgi:FkbM family methyltransferase
MIKSVVLVLTNKGFLGFVTAVYYELKSTLLFRLFGIRFIEKRIYDYKMLLDTRDRGIGRTLILFGRREEEHRVMLQKVLRPGMTVLDIGANIGYYALMEHGLIGPDGVIVAVEPSQENITILKKNLELNGCKNVHVFHGAVSDKNGSKAIFLSDFSNLHSFHRRQDDAEKQGGRTEEVTTYTVPSIMDRFSSPDLIRMDVEGHEVEVLNGMLDAVENSEMAPMIIFETHRRHYVADHDMVEPLRRLFAAGYTCRYVGSSSEWGSEQLDGMGYQGGPQIPTDFMTRRIYEHIKDDDAIELICHRGGVRTVLLVHGKQPT